MLCQKQETKRDVNIVKKFGIIFSLNRIHYLPLKYWSLIFNFSFFALCERNFPCIYLRLVLLSKNSQSNLSFLKYFISLYHSLKYESDRFHKTGNQ